MQTPVAKAKTKQPPSEDTEDPEVAQSKVAKELSQRFSNTAPEDSSTIKPPKMLMMLLKYEVTQLQ
jgi:hypothetical protein